MSSLEGVSGYEKDAFEKVHAAGGGQVTSIRYNPLKLPPALRDGGTAAGPGLVLPSGSATGAASGVPMERVPWSSYGYYLPERPSFTFDPLFHAGTYYVQEASSMFLEVALRQTADCSRPLRVLDCCAAPGGKSTLIQSVLAPGSLLVSNEVIRTRVNILQENMVKWGAANTVITSNDPRDLGRMENFFHVIVVDAPCSGSGLFRRDPEAIREWSLDSVEACHQRQQRILADCWPALREDGILIYSTCSYSREEDEDILDWMVEDLDCESCRLAIDADWNIVETRGARGAYGYRFFPDRLKGEGFFLAALRKRGGGSFNYPKNKKPALEKLNRSELQIVQHWVGKDLPLTFFRHHEEIHALPEMLAEDLAYLQGTAYMKKAGVIMGKLAGSSFIPEHDLALSSIINPELAAIGITKEQAIQYLRKEELRLDGAPTGWTLVRYLGQNLGWVKVLPNRVNNYYPKEWRILKRDP